MPLRPLRFKLLSLPLLSPWNRRQHKLAILGALQNLLQLRSQLREDQPLSIQRSFTHPTNTRASGATPVTNSRPRGRRSEIFPTQQTFPITTPAFAVIDNSSSRDRLSPAPAPRFAPFATCGPRRGKMRGSLLANRTMLVKRRRRKTNASSPSSSRTTNIRT